MRDFEEAKEHEYVFGFEESYGCLVGTHARDKDGIVAVMMLAEAAAYYKKQGLTLWDQMINIYEKYGYYKESQVSITMKGADGAEKIKVKRKRLSFLSQMFYIMNLLIMSGVVLDLLVQSLRLSSIWVLRLRQWRKLIRDWLNLKRNF